MDLLNKEVLDSMHTLASAMVFKPVDKTKLNVDYEKEIIEFQYGDCPSSITVNCRYDSQAAAIKDFAKQLLMQIEL